MIVVLAIDALEYDLVQEFDCKNLKQKFFGKTDISEFSQPRTMVLWSSFMTGKNKEKDIVSSTSSVDWNYKIPWEETFFSKFSKIKVIDLPGYNYDARQHDSEREFLKLFFEENADKLAILQKYNTHTMDHHKKIKTEFESALNRNYDLLVGYFSAIDVIGHLNFGNEMLMKILYKEMDELAKKISSADNASHLIVLSDHGMYPIGQYGDHSTYGFWSTNFKDLNSVKITDFATLILNLKK